MANLTEEATWTSVHELATTDLVQGGPGGASNLQPQQLTNRTKFLKDAVEEIEEDVEDLTEHTTPLLLVEDDEGPGEEYARVGILTRRMRMVAASLWEVCVSTVVSLRATSQRVESRLPIVGSDGATPQYGVHGDAEVEFDSGGQVLDMTAPEAPCLNHIIRVIESFAGTLEFPQPAQFLGYTKVIVNPTTHDVTIKCGADTASVVTAGKIAHVAFFRSGSSRVTIVSSRTL